MKNRITEAIILAVAVVIFGACIYCGMKKMVNRDRVVHVRGLAEIEVPADKVFWGLNFNELGDDIPTIYKKISEKNSVVKEFLKKYGIQDSEITVNAPDVTDNEEIVYREKAPKFRYTVSSYISIASTNIEAVRKLQTAIAELVSQGITVRANYADFQFTGLNTVKPKMIEDATHNAREVAEKFAKDSESKLGKIRSASQGYFSIDDRDQNTPYIKKVRVVTTVDFSLED